MTQGERVKEIRKSEKVNLTMEKFGERIGLKKSAVSLIESGKNALTDANIKSICREFGVDYMWLTTGDGEMFVETDDDFLKELTASWRVRMKPAKICSRLCFMPLTRTLRHSPAL